MTDFVSFVKDQYTNLPYPSGDFSGKTVIVTGGNTGIGLEVARHFVRLNAARVILAVRSSSRGEAAKADIETTTGKSGTIDVWTLDLSSWKSIEEFCHRATEELTRIDVVVENAGTAEGDFKLVEGHEVTIMVSVLGTFYLAMLLMPKLRETSRRHNTQPTLAIVSSRSHVEAKFAEGQYEDVFEALSNESKSDMMDRYQTSKLLVVYLTRAMADAFPFETNGVVINNTNPGMCAGTAIWSKAPLIVRTILNILCIFMGRTTEVGSRNLLAAALAGADSHGAYMTECQVANSKLAPRVTRDEGRVEQEKVWKGFVEIIERRQPGVVERVLQK